MDAPRFRWLGAGRIALEDGYDALVASGLRSRGHQFPSSREAVSFGAAQAVLVDPIEGEAVGASDSRTDGYAVKV
jgi:gamma-glutamyltranspeptidase